MTHTKSEFVEFAAQGHRLRAKMTIDEAAALAHIDRCMLIKYEQERTRRMKRTVKLLFEKYIKP